MTSSRKTPWLIFVLLLIIAALLCATIGYLLDIYSIKDIKFVFSQKTENKYIILRDLIVLMGASVALWLSFERRRIENKQAEIATKTLGLATKDQMAKRLFESAKLLSDKSITARLAGISGLWGIAQNTPDPIERHMVFDLLCAFIRNPPIDEAVSLDPETTRADLAAAFRLMSSPHEAWWKNYVRDFSGVRLGQLTLPKSDFSNSIMNNIRFDHVTLGDQSSFDDSQIIYTDFIHLTADGASFRGTTLHKVMFSDGSIKGGIFDDIDSYPPKGMSIKLKKSGIERTSLEIISPTPGVLLFLTQIRGATFSNSGKNSSIIRILCSPAGCIVNNVNNKLDLQFSHQCQDPNDFFSLDDPTIVNGVPVTSFPDFQAAMEKVSS